jgi:hypothetical protein
LTEQVQGLAAELRDAYPGADPTWHVCAVSALITLAVLADLKSSVMPGAQAEATCRYLWRLSEQIAHTNDLPFEIDSHEWMLRVLTLGTDPTSRAEFRQWIEDRLDLGSPPQRELLNVFVALPLTGVVGDERDEATALGVVAGEVVCESGGTVEGRQPAFSVTERAPSHIARLDHAGLVTADVVIILLTRAASGLGVILSLSVAAGALVAILHPEDAQVSPLVQGHPGDVERLPYSHTDEVGDLLRDFFRRRHVDAWEQRAHRLARPKRWAAPYAHVVQHVRRRGPIGRSKKWPADQVEQAIQSIDHFAAAPSDLTEDLIAAAAAHQVPRGEGRPLDHEEIQAAFALVGRLPKERVALLLAEAGRRLAVGESRARFTAALWLQFDAELP